MTAKKKPEAEKETDIKRVPEAAPAIPRGKPDPNVVQRQASDPSASVWVTASAGTGKTKVLTDRVLRLMLNGSAPDQILCVTFTRAAASVMTNRIREELSNWATCDDATLEDRLTKLNGIKPDDVTTKRARQMFAEFLDAYGGLRVQTIHSFSQTLLRRFPIESGIPPYFDVMDEQSSSEMLREAQADVLRQAQKDPTTPLARAVQLITPEVSEDEFAATIGDLTYRRGQLFSIFNKDGGMETTIDNIYKYLGAPKGLDSTTMSRDLNSNAGLNGDAPDIKALKEAADLLAGGTQGDLEKAKVIKAWILHPAQRQELFWDYVNVFLTQDKNVRKRLTTKASEGAQEAMEREAQRLIKGIEAISTMNVARGTESLLRITGAVLERYTEKKRSLNQLDYDDLIYHANKMMKQDNAAGWVLQKLPGNIKHILVDEAQDTNPDQWELVTAIAKEFFENPARKASKDNTIFVVGDEKQSIFSFQRADPREFNLHKQAFEDMVKKSGGRWREVEMEIAFRSSPAITRAVDAVFANPAAADGLFFDGDKDKQVRHNPFRRGQAGVVEVHPVIRPGEKEPETPWELPLKMKEAPDPSGDMADKIADQIKGWLDSGEQLQSRKRPISPADIVILVRRRSEFVDNMVRALKKRDIPVAGADRMSLREQIAVMDMVALGECLLFPKDDYKLACVLKSPLVGMNDKQLENLAVGRPGDLWDALAAKAKDAKADKIYREAFGYLEGLQKSLNDERPYEFYSTVLMNACPANAMSGLNAMYSRMGFEAEDPLVEFMNAVERFEKLHVPSLQGFISWLDAGEAEVKRELNMNPETPRVHIMTVHGAKGLEAPIVFLPDTTGLPEDNARARPKFLWPDHERAVPLWVPRAELESSVFAAEREKAEQERDQEFRRLMYVAMTRAADRLYVYGYQNTDDVSPKSWYSLIRKGIAENLKDDITVIKPPKDYGAPKPVSATTDFNKKAKPSLEPEDTDETILRFAVKQTARQQPDGLKAAPKGKTVGIPVWARTAPKSDQTPVEKFRPSEYKSTNDNISAPSPLEAEKETYYRRLGSVVHELFEFLPALPADEREAAAKKHVSKPGFGLTAQDQEVSVKEVLKILNDPHFGGLFGPNSRAEVSITGLFERDGVKQMMSGQIDRLVVDDKSVLIVDFKNSVHIPKSADEVTDKYVMQMAAYRLALQQIYPDKEIKCALLYTRKAKIVSLPNDKLDAALKKINLTPHDPKKPAAPKGPTP
ncbi:MAG: double-strand break repair helicase AddA [Alphaproteobacteria bacterium]